jgi:hypothetical protein
MQKQENNWPKTKNGRNLCSPAHPMPRGASGLWEHTNTEEVGDQTNGYPGGDIITIRCNDCGEKWKVELPQ